MFRLLYEIKNGFRPFRSADPKTTVANQLKQEVQKAPIFRDRKHILVIDDMSPNPKLGNGLPRAHDILKVIAQTGMQITFIPTRYHKMDPESDRYFQEHGVEMVYSPRNINDLHVKGLLKKRAPSFDYAFISRPSNMKAFQNVLARSNPRLKFLYDAEAIFALREIAYSENILGKKLSDVKKAKMIRKEINYTKKAEIVFTVSHGEKKLFEAFGAQNVKVVSQSVVPRQTEKEFSHRRGLLFVGSVLTSNSPNEDAILYFLRDIYPLISKTEQIPVYIAGANNSKRVAACAGDTVKILGRVDDLYDLYNSCRVFIAPTRFAAGIAIKVVETAGYGLPMVVTPLLASQIDWEDGREVLVGSNAESFAKKCIELYNNQELWERIRKRSFERVVNDYSPESFKRTIIESLESLQGIADVK